MKPSDLVTLSAARAAAADGTARRLRQAAHLTQREIADVCGVTPRAVSQWESGGRVPRGLPALAYGRLLAALAAAALKIASEMIVGLLTNPARTVLTRR